MVVVCMAAASDNELMVLRDWLNGHQSRLDLRHYIKRTGLAEKCVAGRDNSVPRPFYASSTTLTLCTVWVKKVAP